MAIIFVPIEQYQNKLYQNEQSTKNFLELSEKQLSELSKKVYKKQEVMSKTIKQNSENILNLEIYQKTLEYLTNPLIHLELKTFDEKMAYLIMMVDPNLVTFKEYLKKNIISKNKIEKTENKIEKNNLTKIRNQSISEYKSIVRKKIGFFDAKMLKYEEIFFNNIYNEKELITEVGNSNINKLMIYTKQMKDFSSISDERYQELVNISQTWLSLIPNQYNYKIASYSVTHQPKLLGINNTTEQLTLFILLTDSNLDMLKIYEEESNMKNVKERIFEQFGFFNKDLLALEQKFYDRFCPGKELSTWTKIKKD